MGDEKVYFFGLGAGDIELVTLKIARLEELKELDVRNALWKSLQNP